MKQPSEWAHETFQQTMSAIACRGASLDAMTIANLANDIALAHKHIASTVPVYLPEQKPLKP